VTKAVSDMTAPSLPRRRLDRQSRRQVIGLLIGLALVWLTMAFLATMGVFKIAAPPKYLSQLKRLQNANPEADAEKEYQSGIYKLYVLEQSDRQKIPGVPNPAERIQQLGVRVIFIPFEKGDKAQDRLQHAAFDYAFKYNVAMLKLVDKHGLPIASPATRPQTQPPPIPARSGTPRPATQP
jgi:hypothetical protein